MIIKPIRRLDNENLLPCDFNLIRSVAFIFRPTNVNLSLKDIACLKLCLAFINSIFSCQENSRESLMHPSYGINHLLLLTCLKNLLHLIK